ncbi:tenascin-like [Tribolium madens]|uniref:tenascin-like n=1 Tax=Tribolium madens TaxID=41895 RepID=UPI001CF74471|nr:tenascin-like [Tribolium madens]
MIYATLIIILPIILTVSGSALHGPCETNENCGTLDTFCQNGTCVCRDNFRVFDDHCVQIATPAIPCAHKTVCKTSLGPKGICVDKHCACRSFHHFFNKQCVKSKGLDEECDSDHQCYCGEDCNDKIGCVNRICTCKTGFKIKGRRCIPDPNFVHEKSTASTKIVLIYVKLLSVLYFLNI